MVLHCSGGIFMLTAARIVLILMPVEVRSIA
jgi:hypothetical protein